MCRRVLLVVLWLLIATRLSLLVVGLLSIAGPLCPSLFLFGTILVTLCLMVSRAEPMLSCWHDLLFLWCLLQFYLLHPSMGWLCGVGVFGLIVFSLSSGFAQRTPNNNNNNKTGDGGWFVIFRLFKSILFFVNWISLYFFHFLENFTRLCLLLLYFD